jgi:hypothetical protein
MADRTISRPSKESGAHSSINAAYGKSHKLSLNVSSLTGRRLRKLAFEHRLSESSIVEASLQLFFDRGDDATLGELLRDLGASLRRK